ncbi:MAG: AMP-binding protein, partial [Syntrophales bacterium]|nr:AMP-binding protein [Syntrophales bacterium]
MISERQKTNSAETDMSHLALVLRRAAERFGNKTAMRFKTPQGWMSLSFRDVYGNARLVSKAILELNVRPGEMVGIFSPNRPEWAVADYAILGIRGVSVPIYATSSSRQAEYIIRDAG